MKWIIEPFQIKYTLTDALRSGRSHGLLDNDQTKTTEHVDENSGMSASHVAQEFGHQKIRIFPLSHFCIARTEAGRLHSTLQP